MFAVIKTGGRQYRVAPDDVLEVGKIEGEVGSIVQLNEVLVVGGDTPILGLPTVAGASVAVEVLDHKRGPRSSRSRSAAARIRAASVATATRSRCCASARS
jgi:large subunit ribosomal protein L21